MNITWVKKLLGIPEAQAPITTAPAPMPSSQPLPKDPVWWHLVVLILDQPNVVEKVDIPLKEVADFLRANSRFDLKVTFLTFNDAHGYSGPYGTENRYDLHWSALPQKWIAKIPPCSAVLSLYKLNGKAPIHAGSTWSLTDGIEINGKKRTYAAIPTDLWFYNNQSYEGFHSRAAQICTHEIINTIQGKLESPPYNCGQLTGTPGDPAYKYESDRLADVQPGCYVALGQNED